MLLYRRNNFLFWSIMAIILIVSVIALLFWTNGIAAADDGLWEAAYWNNPDMQGPPVLVRLEPAIDHDWKGLSPDVSINVDNFSAHWTRTVHFAPGTYRFKATMDDGMRVSINNKVIINDYREGKVRTMEADVVLSGGPHTIDVEYFEKGGVAIAGFTWHQVVDGYPPDGGKPMPPPPQPEHPIAPMPPVSGPPTGPSQPSPEHPTAPYPPGKPGGPGMPAPNQPIGYVKTSFLNVRQGPAASYASIAVLPKGTEVMMVARNSSGSWVEIMNQQGSRGWVNGYYLDTKYPVHNLPVASGIGQTNEPRGTVNVANLNVRFGPGMHFGVFAILHQGESVSIIARNHEGTWLKVRISSGAEGWVNAKYITGNYSIRHLPVAG